MDYMSIIQTIMLGILSFMGTAILGFIIWFFKSVYSDHKLVFEYYTKNKDSDIHKILTDMEGLKKELLKVENDSKRYWEEQKIRAISNYESLLERVNHYNENNKVGNSVLLEILKRVESRIGGIEERLNRTDEKIDGKEDKK